MSKLPPKQAEFVKQYLVDLNASAAAMRAGYSAKTADQIAYQLLQKTSVREAIQAAMEERSRRTEITADRVLQELARMAFFDARRLFANDGSPLPVTEMDEDTARAVVGLDVATVGNADIGIGQVLKLKLADKKGALELLGRHLGMWKDKTEISGPDGGPIVTKSAAEMTDDELAAIAAGKRT
jgi:phage terminase small subunit